MVKAGTNFTKPRTVPKADKERIYVVAESKAFSEGPSPAHKDFLVNLDLDLHRPKGQVRFCISKQQAAKPFRYGPQYVRGTFDLTSAGLPLLSTPCTVTAFLARSITTVIMFMVFAFLGVDGMT